MRSGLRTLSVTVALMYSLMAGASSGYAKGSAPARKQSRPQEVKISVTRAGFEPATVVVRKNVPIILVVTRRTDQTCATQAVFPSIAEPVDLPLNMAVRVALPAQPAGRLDFACGMGMFHGQIVVH